MSDEKVTRFEVIDHRGKPTRLGYGRAFVAWDVKVDVSYQDDGRTLKVFINERAGRADGGSDG